MIRIFSINEWWDQLTAAHQVFWFIAIVFSVLFFIQFVLVLIGADTADGELELDNEGTSFEHEFSALSVRSIIAFFTFFGWTGVLALNNQLSIWVAIALASVAGLAAMFIVAYLMYKFAQLEQSGTLNLYHALDQEGEVYLPIPESNTGRGKVHLKVDGRIRELEAITKGSALQTGDPIKVVEILEDNVLRVELQPPAKEK